MVLCFPLALLALFSVFIYQKTEKQISRNWEQRKPMNFASSMAVIVLDCCNLIMFLSKFFVHCLILLGIGILNFSSHSSFPISLSLSLSRISQPNFDSIHPLFLGLYFWFLLKRSYEFDSYS